MNRDYPFFLVRTQQYSVPISTIILLCRQRYFIEITYVSFMFLLIVLLWKGDPHINRGGRRDVDAGKDTLLPGKVLLVAYVKGAQ